MNFALLALVVISLLVWHIIEPNPFHNFIQLRLDIFVVEQDCPYLDLDGKDEIAYHLFATTDQGKTVAYTRLFAPGDYYDEAAIGRVVVHQDFCT